MASKKEETSCLDRFLRKNPGKTEEDFKEAKRVFDMSHKKAPPPRVIYAADGSLIPVQNVDSQDIATMNKEFAKSAYGQQ